MRDVTTCMDCYKEDVVGPILLCMQADNLDEAISIINSSKLRSCASIFTSSCAAARKFQNEVETSLVGINVPALLSLPLSTFNYSAVTGDFDFCEKAEVHFYTQSKTVLQRWKELPRVRAPSLHPHPPAFETETSSQGTSSEQLHGSEREAVGGVGMPSAVREIICDNVSSFPRPASEDSPMPSALSAHETETPTHKGSTMSDTVILADVASRGVPTSMASMSSDGMFYYTAPREEVNVPSPTSERFCLPTMSRNVDMAMMPFGHNGPPFSDIVHLPAVSEQTENVCPTTSQRPGVSCGSTSDSIYLHVSQGNDVLRLNEDVSLQQASASLSTAYFPQVIPPQTTDEVRQRGEMSLELAMQRSNGASPSSSL